MVSNESKERLYGVSSLLIERVFGVSERKVGAMRSEATKRWTFALCAAFGARLASFPALLAQNPHLLNPFPVKKIGKKVPYLLPASSPPPNLSPSSMTFSRLKS